jgi:hypothetical protein
MSAMSRDHGDDGDLAKILPARRMLTVSRSFGFLTLVAVVAIGAYIYVRQTQNVMTAGATNPTGTLDIIGVKNDLLAIAKAERAYSATNGKYVSIDELRAQGALTMLRERRGPYSYSAEVSDLDFRIVATYSGPENSGMPKTLSIDESMQISQQ